MRSPCVTAHRTRARVRRATLDSSEMMSRAKSPGSFSSSGDLLPAFFLAELGDVCGVMLAMPLVKKKQPIDCPFTMFRVNENSCKLLRLQRAPQAIPASMQRVQQRLRYLNRRGLRVRQFRPSCLLIRLDGWLFLGERQLQADVGGQVAVRDVMHDLPHGPATVAIWRIELRIVQAFHRGAQFRRCRRDLLDRPLTPHRRRLGWHFEFSNRVARIHRELLLGQPDISLDYRRSNLSGSTLARTKRLTNLAASIPNRPVGNATIPALLYLAGAVLNLMSGEKSKCITSL